MQSQNDSGGPNTRSPSQQRAAKELATALKEGRIDHVFELGGKMLERDPYDYNALLLTGLASIRNGDIANAIQRLERATLQLDDSLVAPARVQLANAHFASGLPERGLAVLAVQAMQKPGEIGSWIEFGKLCERAGQHLAALGAYQIASSVDQRSSLGFFHMGNALALLDRHEEAVSNYQLAIERSPLPDAYFNLGNSLRALNRSFEAIEAYDAALSLKCDFVGALNNKALALIDQEDLPAADATLDVALTVEPNNPEVLRSKANTLLYNGLSREGCEAYDHRRRVPPFSKLKDYGLPSLEGSTPRRKRILVQWEQAFGDIIQMLRFVPLLEDQADACVWQLAAPLEDLMRRSFPSVQVIGLSDVPKNCTHRVLFTSLPLILEVFSDVEVPAEVPYLVPSPEKVSWWRDELPVGFRVGITWRGRERPANRSIPLEKLKPVLELEDICFVALQPELTNAEKNILDGCGTAFDASKHLRTFDDTAAAIEAVDAVLTIDTATAHLAGALGKETLIMLKKGADWRWKLDRSDCIWYPSLCLYRQDELGNWDKVISNARQHLQKLRSQNSP